MLPGTCSAWNIRRQMMLHDAAVVDVGHSSEANRFCRSTFTSEVDRPACQTSSHCLTSPPSAFCRHTFHTTMSPSVRGKAKPSRSDFHDELPDRRKPKSPYEGGTRWAQSVKVNCFLRIRAHEIQLRCAHWLVRILLFRREGPSRSKQRRSDLRSLNPRPLPC